MSTACRNPPPLFLLFVCLTLPGINSQAADTPAQAAANPGQTKGKTETLDESFARVDKNGDGVISKEEAAVGKIISLITRFSFYDRDGNGSISRQEFREFSQSVHTVDATVWV